MPHIDPKEHAPSQILNCPKSGQLLGAIVSAFRLDDPAVGGDSACHLSSAKRPAKEYFAGKWTVDEKRTAVCEWVAKALQASGVLGDPHFPPDSERDSVPIDLVLAGTMRAWLADWDATYRVIATRWPKADQALGGYVLGRQVVIDLALRWVAIHYVTGNDHPPHEGQPWCNRDGASRILRDLLDDLAPKMSLDERSDLFGVDPRTLDRWLSPKEAQIPSEESLAAISEAFATRAGVQARSVLVRLRRQYGMYALLGELAQHIGWEWALELAKSVVDFARRTIEDFDVETPTAEFLQNQSCSLILGAKFPLNQVVLDEWLRREERPFWKDDVLAARDQAVEQRLTGCFRVIGNWHAENSAKLPTDLGRTPEERRTILEAAALCSMNDNTLTPELAQSLMQDGQHVVRIPATDDATRIGNRLAQAMTAIQHGDYDGSLVHWARIVGLDPQNAKYRFFYGAALWQAKHSRDYERAVEQLEEACLLEPNWDRPFVEIAIIWLNRGQPEMALHQLEGETAGFRESSDHYNWQLGVALRQLDRFDEALAAFEHATDLNPQHASAWDFAADCAFQLDQAVKGRRYARRAFDLGRDTSYRKWVA